MPKRGRRKEGEEELRKWIQKEETEIILKGGGEKRLTFAKSEVGPQLVGEEEEGKINE